MSQCFIKDSHVCAEFLSSSSLGHRFRYGIRSCIIALFLWLSLYLWWTVSRAPATKSGDQFEWLRGSRDLRHYVQPDDHTIILGPTTPCDNRLRLLILVSSAPGNGEQRQAVRDTWGYSAPTPATRLLFFLGHDGKEWPTRVTESVMSEAQKYGDIVVENFIDSYHNLTLKTVFMLKWTLKYCTSVPFVLKTDDDMLINIQALLQELQDIRFKPSKSLIIGKIQKGSMPYRDKSSKWYLPHWLYEAKHFPNFASGPGYVMTQKAVPELYFTALDTPLIPLEDVFLTGQIATEKLGIPLINVPSIHNDRPIFVEHPCLYHHLLMAHELTPAQLRRLWTNLKTLKPAKCDSFYARFLASIFGTGHYEVISDVIW